MATVLAVTVGLLLKLAETVTVFGVGSDAGAVYRPLASIVPTVVLPPAVPFTAQITVFELLFDT